MLDLGSQGQAWEQSSRVSCLCERREDARGYGSRTCSLGSVLANFSHQLGDRTPAAFAASIVELLDISSSFRSAGLFGCGGAPISQVTQLGVGGKKEQPRGLTLILQRARARAERPMRCDVQSEFSDTMASRGILL